MMCQTLPRAEYEKMRFEIYEGFFPNSYPTENKDEIPRMNVEMGM